MAYKRNSKVKIIEVLSMTHLTRKEQAALLGMTTRCLSTWTNRLKMPRRFINQEHSRDEIIRVLEMDDLNRSEQGAMLGVSDRTIRNWAARLDMRRDKFRRKPSEPSSSK